MPALTPTGTWCSASHPVWWLGGTGQERVCPAAAGRRPGREPICQPGSRGPLSCLACTTQSLVQIVQDHCTDVTRPSRYQGITVTEHGHYHLRERCASLLVVVHAIAWRSTCHAQLLHQLCKDSKPGCGLQNRTMTQRMVNASKAGYMQADTCIQFHMTAELLKKKRLCPQVTIGMTGVKFGIRQTHQYPSSPLCRGTHVGQAVCQTSRDSPCFTLQVAAAYPAILQVCNLPRRNSFKQERLELVNIKSVGKPVLVRERLRARMQHKVCCMLQNAKFVP